jgi:Tol biopolymer transport system component
MQKLTQLQLVILALMLLAISACSTVAQTEKPIATSLATSEISGNVTYTATASDGNSQIFLANLETREIWQLTFTESNSEPVWSPDGKHIAYAVYKLNDSSVNIAVMNSDGSNQRLLTQCSGYAASPDWSPDESELVYTSDCNGNNDNALFTLNINTGKIVRLTNKAGNYYAPSWSPDGSRIAFVFQQQIHIIHVGKTETEQITFEDLPVQRLAWCPDNTCIVYEVGTGIRNKISRLKTITLASQETKPFLADSLATAPDTDEWLPSLSPKSELVTFSIDNMLYAMDMKESRLHPLGLQSFGGSLYP